MNRGNVLLRVDGTAKLGMGRLARCLALANALQRRRYQMYFLSQVDNVGWPDRIRRFRHNVVKTVHPAGSAEDRRDVLKEIDKRNAVVFITDSPNIDEELLAQISNRVPLLISLDNEAAMRFPSDLVLNPTLCKDPEDYGLYPGSQLLCGDKYAMIRAEFRRARNIRATEPGGPQRTMISLGGGQVAKETYPIAKALLTQTKMEKVDAIIGTGTADLEKLQALAADHSDRLSIVHDSRDMATRMTKAHLLITSGGNTAMEAACVGVPMLVLSRNEVQAENAARLEEIGVCQYMGVQGEADPALVARTAIEVLADNFERKAMSRSGRMLIDGRGADRIVTATEILIRRCKRSKALAA